MNAEEIKEWWNTAVTHDKHDMIDTINILLERIQSLTATNIALQTAYDTEHNKTIELEQTLDRIASINNLYTTTGNIARAALGR